MIFQVIFPFFKEVSTRRIIYQRIRTLKEIYQIISETLHAMKRIQEREQLINLINPGQLSLITGFRNELSPTMER